MEVRNCSTCGKIFNSVMDQKRCLVCRQADEEVFREIRNYLYDNPGASIEEVSDTLELERTKVLHFLREGRLETVGANMVLSCEQCGVLITSGHLCDDCSRKSSMNIRGVSNVKTTKKSNKMYSKVKK